jgi:hypothetical protein
MTPPSMSVMNAASSSRSTVHHHSLKGVRCSRKSWAVAPCHRLTGYYSRIMVSGGLRMGKYEKNSRQSVKKPAPHRHCERSEAIPLRV